MSGVGVDDGVRVGMNMGTLVATSVLGKTEGRSDGSLVTGFADGAIILVGPELGTEVGGDDGCFVGLREG